MPVTIKEIAERLGISSATVSMALNGRPGVSPKTRQRVLDYVSKVRYEGNTANRQRKSNGILNFFVYKRHGKVLADTQFFSELIEAVERAARSVDYNVSLTYCMGKEQAQSAVESLRAAGPDGVLLLATEMEEEDFAPFRGLAVPMTVLDCELCDGGADEIVIRNREGIGQAVRCLYEHGHREIGYLGSSVSIRNFEQREEGYRLAMQKLGLAVPKDGIVLIEPTVEGAYEDMRRCLRHTPALPTAFAAANDIIAFGAAKALKECGYRIPEDVSLVGFDDVSICTFAEPGLTSVNVPRSALGELAVKQLISRIQNPDAPFVRISVGTKLKERMSVRTIGGRITGDG